MAPTKILLRSRKDPFTPYSADRTYKHNTIGSNVGNLVFSHASHRILTRPDAEVSSIRSSSSLRDPRVADREFDHFVIPLANAFRPGFHKFLDNLSEYIETLTIPVTVLGVGAQARLGGDTTKIDPMADSVRRFMRAVLDRSPSVGVRGEFTREYLADLGFGDEHVEVVGCPSMFLRGPELTIRDASQPLTRDSRVALNISPYVDKMGPISLANAERYPNLTYFAQDINTLGLMMWGSYSGSGTDVRVPITTDHRLYREDRMRFCLDPWTWFDELAKHEFSFGTRIHGNIAALLAGTPAVVLAHDSRTLELAEYYEIPFRKITELSDDVDAASLHAEADWGPLQTGHAARWDTFAAFLHRHGLKHAFEEGGDLTTFDAKVAEARFPAPVHTLAHPETVGQRLRYLQKQIDVATSSRSRAAADDDLDVEAPTGSSLDLLGRARGAGRKVVTAAGAAARRLRRAVSR